MKRIAVLTAAVALAASVSGPTEFRPSPVASARAVLVIEGRGYGHGFGMGQYGARWMAERGARAARILHHYYRAARIERRDPGAIRVLVRSARTIAFTGRGLEARREGRAIASAPWLRVRREGRIAYVGRARHARGPWRRVTRTRAPVTVRARAGRLWLRIPGDGMRAYPGSIRVVRRAGALAAIAVIPLDDYVAGVVPREMPASWPFEALRAQAIAARTYAARVRRVARDRGADYDICATTACQVYGGDVWRARPRSAAIRLTSSRSSRAVRDTGGRVLVLRGEPILAQYSSSSGGWTDDGAYPYLRAVRDRGDRISPYHAWTVRVSPARLERAWARVGRVRAIRVTRRNGHGIWGGRARAVLIRGTGGTARTSGAAFASALGLRSDWFRVRLEDTPGRGGSFVFRRDLGYGARSAGVRALQERLRREGVYPRRAPVTGYFGPITRASVRRYQRAHDISSTGFVGPITRARLNGRPYRFTEDLGLGARSPAVRELKHRLHREGSFRPAAPHGEFFGRRLRVAVRRYQRAHGIPATGYVGPLTRRSLNRGARR